jgi:hypothetical protein
MSFVGRPSIIPVTVAVCVAALWASVTAAQDSKSAAAAKELVQALDAAKMDSMAAPDPVTQGAFVAVLYIPGTQLLVVSAKYAAPQLLTDKITKKDYRDVYVDLQSASMRGSKVFVTDQGADGLAAKPSGDNAADTWDEGDKSVTFDGDWKKAKIAEAEYTKTFNDADDRYAKMLAMLVAQAKKAKPGS